MSVNTAAVADLFNLLESNKLGEVEEIKQVFHEHFLSTKDSWLVNGLLDYYLSTNSSRIVEVLAGVREPHDKHLLDRLAEVITKTGNNKQKIKGLTLLGHIARKQPTWLYKLANHTLFRDLLKLLKVETDTLSLMSALLLLVMLLPMLPVALGPYLQEIFEVFGHLVFYYYQQSLTLSHPRHTTSNMVLSSIDINHLYLLHLQVGLYSLFHRLYAMYPCNFISYLKQQCFQRDQMSTFSHTIRPMLDSVRMHPFLVTASKDTEISATRWKKMEHHDIIAECDRFTLDKCREEVFGVTNSRFTPPLDHSSNFVPLNISGGLTTTEISNGDEETFWSPSMTVPPHSPSFQSTSHEVRSTPSTPNTNRSGTSPPEAAVEATPETTPVKDIRKLSTRQPPVGSAAVRALSILSNGAVTQTSRPSTPIPLNPSVSTIAYSGINSSDTGTTMPGFLSQKISRLIADRQNAVNQSMKLTTTIEDDSGVTETDITQNCKNDSWQEDQEVLEIVSFQNSSSLEIQKSREQKADFQAEKLHGTIADLSQKVQQLRFYSQCQQPIQHINKNLNKLRRTRSCSDMKMQKRMDNNEGKETNFIKKLEESGTQTNSLYQYEYLLLGILDQKEQTSEQKTIQHNSELRVSPTTMLDRYVDICARASGFSNDNNKARRNSTKIKIAEDSTEDDAGEEDNLDTDHVNQLLQLMQMQLQFERQRREVHAERNRRLLGKLRDSRALEEHNNALTDRFRMLEREVENLKIELDKSKRDNREADERYKDVLHHWQTKCVEGERQNQILKDRNESLKLELKEEQKKVAVCEQETRSAEAALFDAGHQLKEALKTANRTKELENNLDIVQKKLLLLGEAQSKWQENIGARSPIVNQEATQIQHTYTDEIANLRRQLESRTSQIEVLRVRLAELESKENRKEAQLVEIQRSLLETKDQHETELNAVESKYKAQLEINLLLESRILELHGKIENLTYGASTSTGNLPSSASPKERTPPLSVSLASSSEGSLAFIHSSTGIMNDCCDSAGEIPNLQAIVEPIPSNQVASPSRSNQQRQFPKQD
ncbi:hamartin isoform X2 [Polistes fuscatus]|uniref:hamartin isoform X2 n=1 Tax=Polistes fuscatus TaxID=30207 RepID=UPI001CA8C03A|nr:hamartin isoform X2 [Polistes fuscatus]